MKAFILQNEMPQNMHKTGQYEQRELDDIRKNMSVFHLINKC